MPPMRAVGKQSHNLSIVGDEQEQHRIQLEHNLQHNNNLSLHLSSSKDDCSLEYPRHTDHHSPYRSLYHHSVENLDPEDQSHVLHYSYRTLEDNTDDGIYVAETLSTAAHHASAVTFTAGLANRRDQTQSGAEYDPDRPLHHIIAGVDSKLSMFGNTHSKSNNIASNQFMFDPLVVDDSAQLDRVLDTGRGLQPTQLHSPLASPSSSSVSSTKSARPKLSDALHRVTFSPKRPRSAQSFLSPRPSRNVHYPPSPSPGKDNFDFPTPRARSKTTGHPHVNVQPPTPTSTSTNSKFTRLARGLAREIEMEQIRVGNQDNAAARSILRNQSRPKGRRHPVKPKSRVSLPDLTGLTSAVESPAKSLHDYLRYDGRSDRESEGRIIATLNVVQLRLNFLESENSLSRRRVKELELELEACKKEVAHERTRILALEVEGVERQQAASMKAHNDRKGKGKEYCTSMEGPSRYKEAVEEKKALETLVSTLRSHLSRLTSELSSHQVLLAELRSLRDADARNLQTKIDNVEQLRDQVERLAGEVEVLKGVVEEGLKERRMMREQSTNSQDESLLNAPPRPRSHDLDKTMRTDYATVGSSNVEGHRTRPFINNEEVERISFELDERRSIRSASSVTSSVSSHHRSFSHAQAHPHSHRQSPTQLSISRDDMADGDSSCQDLKHSIDKPRSSDTATPLELVDRASAAIPAEHVVSKSRPLDNPKKEKPLSDKNPFPQIRGGRLERLFFSAPDHNPHTCNVCHRRRRGNNHEDGEQIASWLPSRFAAQFGANGQESPEDDDEGYAEDSEAEDRMPSDGKGKSTEKVRFADAGVRNKLPPQTVLARVLGELEEDFTHYKGIYVELSDQYKLMDAVSNVVKRNVLAEHLREVIDVLERKGDQIASLYDLLTFKDKPLSHPIDVDQRQTQETNRMGGAQRRYNPTATYK